MPTLAYLHLGSPSHGVTRYGRVLADGARAHLDVEVVERSLELPDDRRAALRALRQAAADLDGADVVHVQYNERIWGEPLRAPFTVQAFADAVPGRLVVTLHDVRDGYGPLALLRRLWAQRASGAQRAAAASVGEDAPVDTTDAWSDVPSTVSAWTVSARKALRFLLHEAANAWATRRLAAAADRVLVCTREEARRARQVVPDDRLHVVPHFVEARPLDRNPDAAKADLGLAGLRVLGVLGYIHRRKGHDRLVEALPHLPDDVVAVFIGRPGRDSPGFARHLQARARSLGVADRLRITGYVEESVLNDYLAATDVAVCPFREASASGSLATWIAAERPILAADLPLFAEYDALAPGAVCRTRAADPESLAAAARRLLNRPPDAIRPALTTLRTHLSLPNVMQQHAETYGIGGLRD